MIKKFSIVAIIAIVVASVAIARFQRTVHRGMARGLSAPTHVDSGMSNLEADTLIAATRASAAPEFAKGTWVNSEPLTLNKMRGRVVLVEFWAFSCYNCRNTLPSIKDWDNRYRDRGLTIVGVHTPETNSEFSLDNLREEIPSLGIKYAVVTDNDQATWKAYNVEAWPTIFVVDKQGRIRWLHVGEGRYDETESVIRTLLAE
jgi:thiol-disulfide isomerase/thioredoxin